MGISSVSHQTLKRLPLYLNYLKSLDTAGESCPKNISATSIAEQLGLNDVQVRKDLSHVSSGGRPKIGYITKELISDIENFLGYDETKKAILIGAGNLGSALMAYGGFKDYGLNIAAAFDNRSGIIGKEINNIPIYSMERFEKYCKETKAKIAIITVPSHAAQDVCTRAVECGILAIWNFAPTFLKVPSGIIVQQENMASSLSVLSNHLSKMIKS